MPELLEFKTDIKTEFLKNMEMFSNSFKKLLEGDIYFYKRSIIHLHMSLHSLFVHYLYTFGDGIPSITKKHISKDNGKRTNIKIVDRFNYEDSLLEKGRIEVKNLLESLNGEEDEDNDIWGEILCHKVTHLININVDLDSFMGLYEKYIKLVTGKYGMCNNLPEEDEIKLRDNAIKYINRYRNNFIHIGTYYWSIDIIDTYPKLNKGVDIIEHILLKSRTKGKMEKTIEMKGIDIMFEENKIKKIQSLFNDIGREFKDIS